ITTWKGKQIHSHNYRTPELFRDQVVILIGSSSSATDISRDIAGVAKEVHISSRSVASETNEKKPCFNTTRLNAMINSGYDNMWLHSKIESVHEDGSVVFTDGSVVVADTILHCTGYKYHFPFLETNGIVTVDEDDNRVGPLFKHVFSPALAPSLSFVGVPSTTLPFPNFELQSKWIAGVLSNRIALPSQEEMMEDVKAFYSSLEASGKPKRQTHDIADYQEFGFWYTGLLCVHLFPCELGITKLPIGSLLPYKFHKEKIHHAASNGMRTLRRYKEGLFNSSTAQIYYRKFSAIGNAKADRPRDQECLV
ncbi:hypothetical protein ABKV19_012741, partial [Rosa sericea]